MHPLLLSAARLVFKEQMLRGLQNIQLGLRYDIHAVCIHTAPVHLELARSIPCPSCDMGDKLQAASGKICKEYERMSYVSELQRKAVQTQETNSKNTAKR